MAKSNIKAVSVEKRSELTPIHEQIQAAMFVISEVHLTLEYVACKEQDRGIYMDMTLHMALNALAIGVEQLEKYCE